MRIATPGISLTTIKRRAAGSVLLAGFTVSLFLSAFLLFSVQPVVSRMLLPRLGGSPAVWNTCVCFFQAALLLGYGYAHFVAGRLRPRAQVVLHALVFCHRHSNPIVRNIYRRAVKHEVNRPNEQHIEIRLRFLS
jgi:hypothetical protein